MTSPIQFTHQWQKPYLPTGGLPKIYLLLEAAGNAPTSARPHRAPMNLSLVLDRSGSMSGDPIRYCKEAARFVLDQLGGEDVLSVVAFDDEVTTVIPPARVRNKERLKHLLQGLQAGGTTNLSGGLLQGIQHVLEHKQEGRVNRVLLLSDGQANEGITDPERMKALAREFQGLGLGVTAMGVGDGFDEELMEGLADGGGGNFYYIRTADDIPGIFAQELKGLLSVVAQNLQVRLRLGEGLQLKQVYGYRVELTDGAWTLPLGDVYDGETKSILLECEVYPHRAGSHQLLEVEWSYADVSDTVPKITRLHTHLAAEFTNDLSLLAEPADSEMEKKIALTESAMVLEQALDAFDEGDEAKGKELLQLQADHLLHAAVCSEDAELREESAKLYSQLESFAYTKETRKSLHEQKYKQLKRKR